MILYKYYGPSGGAKAIASRGQLGFRTSDNFNDPFELSGLSNTPGYDTIFQQIKYLERLGILCLTKSPLNPLMWAHYGDSHKGLVVGYDVSGPFLTDPNFNIIPVQNGDVFYTSQKECASLGPDMHEQFLQEFWDCMGMAPLSSKAVRLLRQVFLQKHLCWAYEEEVRVVKAVTSYGQTQAEFTSEPERIFYQEFEPKEGKDWSNTKPKNGCKGLYLSEVKVPITAVYFGLRCNVGSLGDEARKVLTEVPSLYKIKMAEDSWNLAAMEIQPSDLG